MGRTDGQEGWIGARMTRREDARHLTGAGSFVDDMQPDGCLFLEVFRTSYPAGRIRLLDVSDARTAEGVVAVYTAEDLAGLGAASVNPLIKGARLVPMRVLAGDRVEAVGQPVAAIVAQSRMAAISAAELILLEVEPDEPGAPSGADPVLTHVWRGGDLPKSAAHRVSVRVDHALVAPMALEPRAALAQWDGARLTAWLSTQTPQRGRDDLANMLGLSKDCVRVVAPDVGGAFGGKASLNPEDVLTAFAAWSLSAPVKWCARRGEEFLAAPLGRGAETRAEMALDAEGRALSVRADLRYRMGHWMPFSAFAPPRNAGRILPGPYDIAGLDVQLEARMTATAPVGIYRGAGRPEATILMERLMDRAALSLGCDPMDIRRRNLLPASAMPHRSASGETICSGDFTGLLDRLESETGYRGLRARQAARRAGGEVCGLGLALYIEPCGQGWETAELRLMGDGQIVALTGSSAQGQGRETAVAQIVAEVLGCDPSVIEVCQGDSDAIPKAIGALASRSTAIGGSAMMLAARALLAEARQCTGVGEDDRVCWSGIAADLAAGFVKTEGPVLVTRETYHAKSEAWASGAVLAEVAIDPETGVLTVERITWVDDAGRIVNPLLVEGQLIGGAAQGLGLALMERMVIDDEGQVLTGSLMDYAVPRAADMPPIRIVSQPTATGANPLGAKGVGEAGCIGVPAAVLNAVHDALIPFGAPELQMPLTSERIWRAMTGQTDEL